MKKFFILFAATCIASAAWAQATADADPREITFDGNSAPTSYHFSSVDKVYEYLDEREKRTQTEADRLAEHLFEPLEIISGFNRDIIAEDTVKLDKLKDDDGTLAGGQLVTIAGKKRNGDHLVQSYYVQDAQIANIKSAENPNGTNTIFNAQYISYSYATENVLKWVQSQPDGNRNTRAGFPEPNAEGIRRVECIADGPNDAYVGLHWHLAPYDNLNALCLRKGIAGSNGSTERTGFFEFKNVGCYQKLYFLVAATGSTGKNRILYTTVTYSDGTTDHRSFTFDDHAYILKKISGKVNGVDKTVYDATAYWEKAACHDNFGTYSVSNNNSGVICLTDKNNENPKYYKIGHYQSLSYAIVCEMDVATDKLIDKIDFTTQDPEGKNHTDDGIGLVIFAVTGKVANIAAPDANPAPHSHAPMRTSNITETSFDVEWDAVAGADSYRLDVATDEDFHHMVGIYNNMTVNGTSAHVEGLNDPDDHEYYWRVRSVDASGGQSASSAPRRTRTSGGSVPETGETNSDITAELTPYLNEALPSIKINRTLYRDGYFNTLCLPFDLDAKGIAASPIKDCELFSFVSAEKIGVAQLDIIIRPETEIIAGVPYLVRWANTGDVIPSPLTFTNVEIRDVEGQTIGEENEVRFVGHISQEQIPLYKQDNLFVGEKNTLYWPDNTNSHMKGFRAYFAIPNSSPSSVPRGSAARLVIGANMPTDIDNIQKEQVQSRKVIENGVLLIEHNNVRYNVMGQKVSE